MSYPTRKAPHWSETSDAQPDPRLDAPVTVSHDKESVIVRGENVLLIMSPTQARRLLCALDAACEAVDPTPIPESAPQVVDRATP